MSKVIVNGELRDESDAGVSLLNKDMQLGLNVFETMTAVAGVIDGFGLHLERFQSGLDRLGIAVEDFDLLGGRVRELLEANDFLEKRVRVRMTAMSEFYWIEAHEVAERGEVCSVVLSDYVLNERSPLVGVKCGSYAMNYVALHEAQAAGVDEVLFLNSVGEVAEAATANVFLVKDGVVITPRLESGCLPGVTRALVLERAANAGIEVEENAVSLEDLLDADEVFLTNTGVGVQAVERIGELELGSCPGEVTKRVRTLYLAS